MSSTNNPEFTHVSDAEAVERRAHISLYRRLIDLGYSDEEIRAAAAARPSTRHIGLSLAEQDGAGDPVVGVWYGGDYRYEEERGIGDISEMLSTCKPERQADAMVSGADGKRNWLAIATPEAVRSLYGDEALQRNLSEADRRSREVYYKELWEDRRLSLADLRAALKADGISPLPRKKDAALALFRRHIRGVAEFDSVGEFHDGTWLVMLAAPGILSDTLRLLADVARDGTLRFGGDHNPFSRAAAFFDDRDLAPEIVNSQRAAAAWAAERMGDAAAVVAALSKRGYLYAVRPGHLAPYRYRDADRKNIEYLPEGDYYFINYSLRREKLQGMPEAFAQFEGASQLYGWFTLDELAALAHRA